MKSACMVILLCGLCLCQDRAASQNASQAQNEQVRRNYIEKINEDWRAKKLPASATIEGTTLIDHYSDAQGLFTVLSNDPNFLTDLREMGFTEFVCTDDNTKRYVLDLGTVPVFSHGWERSEKVDPLRGTSFSQFLLQGRFLVPPRHAKDTDVPVMILRCSNDRHSIGYHVYKNGRFLSGYIFTGTVLNSLVLVHEGLFATSFPVVVPVSYRLDGGKMQSEDWHVSTDYSAAFFKSDTLNNFLYGHIVNHKENTNSPVHQIILGLDEAFAGEVQMQFDIPDPTQVAETCGVTYHKKR